MTCVSTYRFRLIKGNAIETRWHSKPGCHTFGLSSDHSSKTEARKLMQVLEVEFVVGRILLTFEFDIHQTKKICMYDLDQPN